MDEILSKNKLVQQFQHVQIRVGDYKQKAKDFYFRVILSAVSCSECGGQLQMSGQSQCICSCGQTLDPTVEFQKSPCCGANLIKKTYHYACTKCHRSVPSRFIFDERVFDRAYFRELMRESRDRKKRKREEIRRLLAESRSKTLIFTEEPELNAIPGLVSDLVEFILGEKFEFYDTGVENGIIFNIEKYWTHIQSMLGWDPVLFSTIPPIDDNYRRDKAYRFITLIYMQNDREIDIEQEGNDLFVQKVHNEAHC